jgi:hypothetical protein
MIELKKDGYYIDSVKVELDHFECKEHSGEHKIDTVIFEGKRMIVSGTCGFENCSECIAFTETIEKKEE